MYSRDTDSEERDRDHRRTTVSDVARRAGVSASTVSRVISDNPRISVRTKEKVLKVMKDMNYIPNAIARSLAIQRTGVIGVVMPQRSSDTLLNPFFPEALRGIVNTASKNGYDILISASSGERDELSVIRNLVTTGKVDGIILLSSREWDPNIRYLKNADFPFTVVGSDSGFGTNHVNNDNVRAAMEVTEYLLEEGRRKLLFASGGLEYSVTRERMEGFRKALESHGLTFRNEMIYTGNFDEQTGARMAEEMMKSGVPDGIVASDDAIAFGMVRYFMDNGIKIPEYISLVSFNNSVLSRYAACPITSVDINAERLGSEALVQVLKALEGLRGDKVVVPFDLIVRNSTGPREIKKV